MTNFHLEASGLPGEILGQLHLDSAIQFILSKGAELAMNPLMKVSDLSIGSDHGYVMVKGAFE